MELHKMKNVFATVSALAFVLVFGMTVLAPVAMAAEKAADCTKITDAAKKAECEKAAAPKK
ncbi:MAG: hypothetical protein A3G18_07355 [Rhodospirillales bacterium RIFCSPLOWO2_12_FULL_58_28]|nr:MAG: hypothetical protein A3H92_08825 [Rhodospirillales bacterium RIFCSPLOWO2_02_FULL_58_16]OHC77543.1 MAG: hypothetical protein A3G18_07355 [Rhodospirillales bacterium RIFCSPLOWO2_12_FULL_58_28]